MIEHETKYLDLLIQRYKNSPDEAEFFGFRKESLTFAKQTIETNVQSGITTQESYLGDVKKFLADTKALMMEAAQALGATHEHTQRLKKRVQILNNEIQTMEGEAQEAVAPEVPNPPPVQTQSAQVANQIGGGFDANDPIELEEKFHAIETFVSCEVIEHETKYLDLLIMKYKNSPDEAEFFANRKESLQFAKETIQSNVEGGMLTPETYLADITQFLASTRKLYVEASKALGATNEHTQRIKKRVSILENEVTEMGGDIGSSVQQSPQPQAAA